MFVKNKWLFLNKKFDAHNNLTQRLCKKSRQIMSVNLKDLYQSNSGVELLNDECVSIMEKLPEASVEV